MKKYISYIIHIIDIKLYIIDIYSMKGVQIYNEKFWEKNLKKKLFNLLYFFLMKFICFYDCFLFWDENEMKLKMSWMNIK